MASQFVVEKLNPNFGYFYRVSGSVTSRRTKFQEMEIIDTPEFGRVMLLDGVTQVAVKNEYLYHEPMVHPAMTAHPDPQSVLVIGAGDGGILREVLRHSPKRVVIAELDGEVIEFCRERIPEIGKGAFDDKRVEVFVGDGRQYVTDTKEVFDVIIMDMTDPFGPSTMLYTREFFAAVRARMRDERGLFVMHSESIISRPRAYQQILRTLSEVWPHQDVFYLYIQMYAVLWSIVVSGNSPTAVAAPPKQVLLERLRARGLAGNTEVYTEETHFSMQVEFPFIKKIRAEAAKSQVVTDAHSEFCDEIDLNSSKSVLKIVETSE